MELNGKNVVITGGARGIGFETVKCFLENGVAKMAILDIVEMPPAVRDLQETFSNTTIIYLLTDISKKQDVEENFQCVFEKLERIDIVVSGAAVEEQSPEETIGVNLLGLIFVNIEACKYMKENRGQGGLIVNIASVLGLQPTVLGPIYTASKHGVIGYTRVLSVQEDLKHNNIRVMAVCPGYTESWGLTQAIQYQMPRLRGLKGQSAEECAVNVINAIKTNRNGSIWILDLGEMREVTPEVYWSPIFQ